MYQKNKVYYEVVDRCLRYQSEMRITCNEALSLLTQRKITRR